MTVLNFLLLWIFYGLGWFLLNVLLFLFRLSPKQMKMATAMVLGLFAATFHTLFKYFF